MGPKGGKNCYHEAWDDGFGGDVKQICICHREYIDSIQTTYKRDGITVVSNRHGGTDGNFDVVSVPVFFQILCYFSLPWFIRLFFT